MAEMLAFRCTSCAAEYAVPDSFKPHLEGRALFCPGCKRWWAPLPAASGPPVRLVDGRPERAKIDLRRFRRSVQASPPAAAQPSGPAPAGAQKTQRVAVPPSTSTPDSLRVVVAGPNTDLKGIFDLGAKDFLIGRRGCHLNLPQAELPDRAIRMRRADGRGFLFEGIDGFPIPIGGMSVLSGRIEPGGTVHFELGPYRVDFETSQTPGSPIADLGSGPPAGSSPPPPSKPKPKPPRLDVPKPRPVLQGEDVDIRAQVQELAVDVRPDQPDFDDSQDEMADLDQTVTDLGARGFQASRFGSGLGDLDISLVRADGPSQGKRFRITKTPILIGRSEGDLVIADRRVSSKHAQLDVAGPRIYTLKDLASTNGTLVNDRSISIGHLQDGDVLSFGGVRFEFHAKVVKAG